MTDQERSKVIVCRGARATEKRLLAEVARLLPRAAVELDPPVRVVVPSRSLRLHLLRRLVETRGAVAGVVVQTLGGVANEIFERAGTAGPVRPAGFDLLARRLARQEPALASELEGLVDGYDAILGAISDLVDAGFGPDHEEGVLERIDELGPAVPLPNRQRAAALVRVTARALEAADIVDAQPRGAIYRLAAELLSEHDERVLPSRALFVHGFADLTGVAADLLTQAVGAVGGLVLLDRVPDPARPVTDDPGNAYLERLEVRLGAARRELDPAPSAAPDLGFAEAADPEAEARWVAEHLRSVIASGARPEAIGVVARTLGSLGLPLRRQLRRLGVPFSGVDARAAGGRSRGRARRLADLIRRGGDAELDLWTELAGGLEGDVALLLGLRVLALARLRDLAELRTDDARLGRGVPLPLADGVSPAGAGRSGRLAPSRVTAAAERARALVAVLDGWPATAVAAGHRRQTSQLVSALGWEPRGDEALAILAAADELAAELPAALEVDASEWTSALVKRLDGVGDEPLGGRGGGVQLLTVTEARARTFDHLVVCGVNRGVFPRQVVDDAMLPDLVRARLASDVLPEMPVKARSADEERYLFAQLLSSAPAVRLSWHLRDDGRRTAPSPFVERLRAAEGAPGTVTAPALWSPHHRRCGPRPAYEHAVASAAAGAGDGLAALLELAVAEGRHGAPSAPATVAADRLAAAREAVVRAAERRPGPSALGPWSGFVGDAVAPGERVWVTHLEQTATCPLRELITRRLGVRPLPDPHLGLPDLDPLLVGSVVHEVLEVIVTGAGCSARVGFEEALEGCPERVPWPAGARVEALLDEAARRVALANGVGGPGFARLLAARARPILAVASEVEWRGGTMVDGVLAAEIEGELRSAAFGPILAFRADRLDTGPVATDYKTGRPLSTVKTPSKRDEHLVKKVESGRVLQAVAYALAAPSGGGVGRYVYLRPDIGDTPPEAREVAASGDDPRLRQAFEASLAVLDEALTEGVAFPRITEPGKRDKPDHCRFCPVAEACRRDDSGFAAQLVAVMAGAEDPGVVGLASARRLWWLGTDREAAS